MSTSKKEFFDTNVFGHPAGLFVLFFTEMWERFSYYGMRALLILFLVAKIDDEGWGWERSEAMSLFGWYVMLVYFVPLLGGWLADNKWGHIKTIIVGASSITLGHAAMAVADLDLAIDTKFLFYIGILLIIVGTGLFKPNMSATVGKMYPANSDKKDSAYTIFYMGVNSGSFIGILLVGWIGENFSWSWGFGLAGIFMFFGLLQFYFARSIFGEAANKPQPKIYELSEEEQKLRVPYTQKDQLFLAVGGFFAITWIVDGLYSVVSRGSHFLAKEVFTFNVFGTDIGVGMPAIFFMLSIIIFVILGTSRIKRFTKVEGDRLKVVFIIAFFVIFFWASFEQAGTSMTIFAKDYTARTLSGNWGLIYKIIDFVLSIGPMVILTWIIYKLAQSIYKKFPLTILFTSISFVIIWALVIFRVYDKITGDSTLVDTSWFQILNPFFIITLAPLFAKLWKKYTFSAPQKFAIGLSLLAAGFGVLAFGSLSIPNGAATAQVSMVWLLLAFLLHTMGELSISPVGLSYVSKLAPARMLAFLFGIWYVFTGLSGKLAATMAENMDGITEATGMSGFFLIFTIIPLIAAAVILMLNGKIKKMMHGIQ
ncbi:MAG: peptide MFS transporter [Flavobacteriaceae bacterium]|nr:peptide MFS transporter [Flavobacteriaceae bacterium]